MSANEVQSVKLYCLSRRFRKGCHAAAASAPAAFAVQEAVVVTAPSRAIFPDRADIGETGRAGAAFSEVRVKYPAQQPGQAAAFALGTRLQGLVLPVVE